MSLALRRFAVGSVALLLATALVACGGDDDDDDAANGGDTQATQQATPTADSGDDDDDDDDDDRSGGGGSGNLPFESGSGTFVVDGQEFDTAFVVSCEPFDGSQFGGAAPHEDDFDLTASDGNIFLEIEVSFQEVSAYSSDASYTAIRMNPFLSRSGQGGTEQFDGSAVTDPDGNWYASEDLFPQFAVEGQPPEGDPLTPPAGLEIIGNNIRGALTLQQSWPEGANGIVEVSFNLDMPPEVIDCSLLN